MSHVRHNGYLILRTASSSSRLNLQHYLWRDTCGFNVHPRIPVPEDGKLKIADIGTGTGIWMGDVKRQYPECEIDGFDISLVQCPPAELAPAGCSFRQLDVLSEIPDALKEVYDVVHLRLWLGVIHDDPVPTIRNLMAMLKPGGYLQWQELNLGALTVSAVREGLDETSVRQLLDEVHNFPIGRWAPRLAAICAENGMLDSRTDRYRVPPDLAIPFCQNQFGAFEEISVNSMDNGSEDAPGPRLRRLIDKAHDDLRKGVVFDYRLEVTVARKPA